MAPFSPLPPCSSPRSPRPVRLPSRPFSHIFGQIKPVPRRPPPSDILCGPESKGWVFGLFVACLVIVCWIATLPSSEPLLSRTTLKALGQELEDMRSALSSDLRAFNHLSRFDSSPELVEEWDVSGIDRLVAGKWGKKGRRVVFGKPSSGAIGASGVDQAEPVPPEESRTASSDEEREQPTSNLDKEKDDGDGKDTREQSLNESSTAEKDGEAVEDNKGDLLVLNMQDSDNEQNHSKELPKKLSTRSRVRRRRGPI